MKFFGDKHKKLLMVIAGVLGISLAVGLRLAQGGITTLTMIGATAAVVAGAITIAVVVKRTSAASPPSGTTAGKSVPARVWWLLAGVVILKAITYLMDRYNP